MFDKLKELELRYNEISDQLVTSEVISDPDKFISLSKELSSIEPLVSKYKLYNKIDLSLKESIDLYNSSGIDNEFKLLLIDEISEYKGQLSEIENDLNKMISNNSSNSNTAILEIRSGAGGEEAALFAYDLFRMYSMYCDNHLWKCSTNYINETEKGGIKEISLKITGVGCYDKLKFESGVHRVQRVPETETQGRIHTSTVTVAVLPEAEEVELDINPKDLQIDTYRSSGAGGQHVNKTESAIRITHLPTGLVVECQDERSQYKNKDKAMKNLKAKLLELEKAKQKSSIDNTRKEQVGTGDRSERIRTYNYPQNRITDHRINYSSFNLQVVMDGNLDVFIDRLTMASIN